MSFQVSSLTGKTEGDIEIMATCFGVKCVLLLLQRAVTVVMVVLFLKLSLSLYLSR